MNRIKYMVPKVLLFILIPALALADTAFVPIGPRTSEKYDVGGVVRRSYMADVNYDSAGTWKPKHYDWGAISGLWAVTNGEQTIGLDTTDDKVWFKQGSHWLGMRVDAAIYYDAALDEWTALATRNVAATWTRTGRVVRSAGYMPGTTLRYNVAPVGLKEYIELDSATRAAMPAPSTYGYSAATTWFGFATRVFDDSLNLDFANLEFGTGFSAGQIAIVTDNDSIIMAIAPSRVYHANDDAQTVPMRVFPRIWNGNKYILSGARVSDLVGLPAGDLIFDPSVTRDTVDNDDNNVLRSTSVEDTVDYTSLTTIQIGMTAKATISSTLQQLAPNSDGSAAYWTDTPDSAFDYMVVNETTADDADYVYITLEGGAPTNWQQFGFTDWSIDPLFHDWDSVYVVVRAKNTKGSNNKIEVQIDTTGYFLVWSIVDTISTTTSWAYYPIFIGTRTEWDTPDDIVVQFRGLDNLTPTSNSYQVSQVYLGIRWQKVTAVGDVRRTVINGPPDIASLPAKPDSTKFFMWHLAGWKGSTDSIDCYAAAILLQEHATPNYTCWNYRTFNASTPLSWNLVGAKYVSNYLVQDSGDIYWIYDSTYVRYADTNTWIEMTVPQHIDTLWYDSTITGSGLLIWSPQDDSQGATSNNKSFASPNYDSNTCYWEFYYTEAAAAGQVIPVVIGW